MRHQRLVHATVHGMTTSPLPRPARSRSTFDVAPHRAGRPRPDADTAPTHALLPRWQLVTLLTAERRPLFGHVVGGRMHLGLGGRHALEGWLESIRARPWIVADVFIVMPDHIHGLIATHADTAAGPASDTGPGFRQTVEGFALGAKSLIARRLRVSELVPPQRRVWQGGMTLHTVRGQAELEALRRHVRENPLRWWRRLGYGFPAPGQAAVSDRVAEDRSSGMVWREPYQ